MKRFLITLLSIAMLLTSSMTAFATEEATKATSKEEATQSETVSKVDDTKESTEETQEAKTYDWSSNTEGNSELIANQTILMENGEYQFIAVSTFTDDVFYIIIDKTKAENNVYFLNEVDTYDIQKLLSKDDDSQPVSTLEDTSETEEATLDDEASTNNATSTDMNYIYLGLGGVAIVGCIVAFVFVSKKKPKAQKNEEEYEDDFEEETINEDEE